MAPSIKDKHIKKDLAMLSTNLKENFDSEPSLTGVPSISTLVDFPAVCKPNGLSAMSKVPETKPIFTTKTDETKQPRSVPANNTATFGESNRRLKLAGLGQNFASHDNTTTSPARGNYSPSDFHRPLSSELHDSPPRIEKSVPSYDDAFPALVASAEVSFTPSPTAFQCFTANKPESATKIERTLATGVQTAYFKNDRHDYATQRSYRPHTHGNINRYKSASGKSSSISHEDTMSSSPVSAREAPTSANHTRTDGTWGATTVSTVCIAGVSIQQWPLQSQRGQIMLGPNPALADRRPKQKAGSASSAPDVAAVDESVYEIRVMLDYVRRGASRGFAFALMATPELARKAIAVLNGKTVRSGVTVEVLESVDNCKLFVGSLPKNRTRDEILTEMSRLTDGVIDVTVYPSAMDKAKTRGFAFVQYETHQAASHARTRLQRNRALLWDDVEAIVDWAEPEKDCADDVMTHVKVLFVRNLMFSTSEDTLYQVFNEYGIVEKVTKLKDFAFVHFRERNDALKAREALNETMLERALIEVHLAKPPPQLAAKSHLSSPHRYKNSNQYDYRNHQSFESSDVSLPNDVRLENLKDTNFKSATTPYFDNSGQIVTSSDRADGSINLQGHTTVNNALVSPLAQQQQHISPPAPTVRFPSSNGGVPLLTNSSYQRYWQNNCVDDAFSDTVVSFPHVSRFPAVESHASNTQYSNAPLLPLSWPVSPLISSLTHQVPFLPSQHSPASTFPRYVGNPMMPSVNVSATLPSDSYPYYAPPSNIIYAQQTVEQQQLIAQQYALHLAMIATAAANATARFNWEQCNIQYRSPSYSVNRGKKYSVTNNLIKRNAIGQPVLATGCATASKQFPRAYRQTFGNSGKTSDNKIVIPSAYQSGPINIQKSSTINMLEDKLRQLSLDSGFDMQPVIRIDEIKFPNPGTALTPAADDVMYRCEIIFPAPEVTVQRKTNGLASGQSITIDNDGKNNGKVLHCKPPALLPSADEARMYGLKFVISNWQRVLKAKADSIGTLSGAVSGDSQGNDNGTSPSALTA